MIGVFDSGLGGLTILRKLLQDFPDEQFIYFGDNAYAPYGGRDPDQIYTLTRRGVEFLFDRGCSLVIIACNTASALALRPLQQQWLPAVSWGQEKIKIGRFKRQRQSAPPAHNVLGVLIPLIEAISGEEWHLRPTMPYAPSPPVERVGFFATKATVDSNRFVNEMARLAPHIDVIQQECPHLVHFIEAEAELERIELGIRGYCGHLMELARARGVDLAVLGCTHFQLYAELFRRHLPERTKLVNQPQTVSDSLARYLKRHPYYRSNHSTLTLENGEAVPQLRFATSGEPSLVASAAIRFWGMEVPFTHKETILKAV